MEHDVKNGHGKHIWSNGDSYEGNWKNNKMEGPGIFRHVGDIPLEGNFKNNYFHMGGDVYVSPFQSRAEIDNFIQRRDDHRKLKESRIKEKLFKLEVTENIEILLNLIKNSAKNSRVPLVLSSKSFYTNLKDFLKALTHYTSSISQDGDEFKICVFDLRRAKLERKHGDYESYIGGIKHGLAECLAVGGLFIINIDDSDVHYEELYDPDLKEFYSRGSIPQQILNRPELKIREVYSKVLSGTEYATKNFNDDFTVSLCLHSTFSL